MTYSLSRWEADQESLPGGPSEELQDLRTQDEIDTAESWEYSDYLDTKEAEELE